MKMENYHIKKDQIQFSTLSTEILLIMNIIATIIIFFASISSIFFILDLDFFGNKIIYIQILSSLFFSILSLIGTFLIRTKRKNANCINIIPYNKLVSLLFIGTTIMTLFNLIGIFVITMAFNSNISDYRLTCISLLIILKCLSFICSLYTYYILETDLNALCSKILPFFIIFSLFLCLFNIFFCLKFQNYYRDSVEEGSDALPLISVDGIISLCIMIIIVNLVSFLLSIKNFKQTLYLATSGSLLLIIILSFLNGFIYKSITDINALYSIDDLSYNQNLNCFAIMKHNHQNDIPDCQKYVNNDNCPIYQQDFLWEEKSFQVLGCLNTNCCPKLNLNSEDLLKSIYIITLMISLIGFIKLIIAFKLSDRKNKFLNNDGNLLNFTLGFILLFLILGSIVFFVKYEFTVPERRPLYRINNNIYNFKNENDKKMSTIQQTNGACFSLENRLSSPYDPKINCKEEAKCSNFVRTILLAKNAKFQLPSNFNSEKIMIFDRRTANLNYPDIDLSSYDYLAIEGKVEDLKEIVKKEISLCPNNIFESVSVIFTNQMVNVIQHLRLNFKKKSHDAQKKIHKTSHLKSNQIFELIIKPSDEKTLNLYGKIIDNDYNPILGAEICYTNLDSELGNSFKCFLKANSDKDGIFELKIKTLKEYSEYDSYLVIRKVGYYDQQTLLEVVNEKSGVKNLGNIHLVPLKNYNGQYSALPEINMAGEQNMEIEFVENEAIYNEFQNSLNLIQFGNIEIQIKSIISPLEPVQEATIDIFQKKLGCDKDLNVIIDPIFSFKTKEHGKIMINDLEFGDYTILIRKKKYQTNCADILVSKRDQTIIKFLAPELKEKQVSILMEWNNPSVMVELHAKFIDDKENKCAVGFEFNYCGGMKFYFTNQTDFLASYIVIDLREYTYLVYLRLQELVKPKEINNANLFYSNVKISYYLFEDEFPSVFLDSLIIPNQKDWKNVMSSKNLAYLFGCLKPQTNNDELISIKKNFWIDQYYERKDKNFPNAEICNLIQ